MKDRAGGEEKNGSEYAKASTKSVSDNYLLISRAHSFLYTNSHGHLLDYQPPLHLDSRPF